MDQRDRVAAPGTAVGAPRIRFVALRGPEPAMLLRFHPRVTVLSGFGDELADWLSSALAHGPHDAPEGFAEVEGARVSLRSLPERIYDIGACTRLPGDAVERDLKLLTDRDANLGSELEEITGAIANAERRKQVIIDRLSTLDHEIARADARIANLQEHTPPARRNVVARERSEDSTQLQQLLDAIDAAGTLAKETDPAAVALIHAFEALDHAARRHRPREEVEEELRKWELVTAEARARLAERRAPAPRVSPSDLAEASRLREALREAHDRKRGVLRRRADDEITVLEGELRALLDRLGARSYEDLMLLGTGLGSADADLAIREATNVVAAAERRCVELRSELSEPNLDELRAERRVLVERATELLGRDPGHDPVVALRAYRVEPAALQDAEVALARKLRELGAHVNGTPAATARALIAEWDEVRAERERGHAELRRLEDDLEDAERAAREGRSMRARLTRELSQRRTEIEDLTYDRRRIEARMRQARPLSTPRVAPLTPAIVDRAVAAMVHRDAITRSPLPVIVENPFAALAPEMRGHALESLARRAIATQIVIVTDDDTTTQWARDASDDLALVWTADDARGAVARAADSTPASA